MIRSVDISVQTYTETNGGTTFVPPVSDYPAQGQDVCPDNKVTLGDRIEFREEIRFVN